MTRSTPYALVATIAMLAASCGSDKPAAQRAVDIDSQKTTDPATSSSPGAGRPGSGPAGDASAGPSTGSPASVRGLIPSRGQGVTDKEIQIGIVDQGNIQAAFGNYFGFDTGPAYTDRQKGEALVKWVNDHGGIAGRKVKPVWSHYDPNQESLDEDLATRCAAFTQDSHVFVTIPFGIGWECYSKRRLVALDGIVAQFHQREYEKASAYMYSVYGMTTDRVARTVVQGLADAGFFKGGKIGLIYFDWPGWKAAVPDLEAALKSRGLKLTDKVEIIRYGDAATLGQASSAAANAVLRFRSKQIDRVLFFDATFLGPGMFMQQAENQGYRPRYGMHSGFSLDAIINDPQPGLTPPVSQLSGSMAVGWIPVGDVGKRAAVSDGRALCRSIMKSANVYANDEPIGMCETLFLLKAALERADEVSVAGLQRSIESLGDSYGPRIGWGTLFGPKRHAGGSAYRTLKFVDGCKCYEYVGGVKSAP
ncbi:MAG: ABC transporter substrate-binding protein [Actinomycetota bacterium]